jgi:hypothetical protein
MNCHRQKDHISPENAWDVALGQVQAKQPEEGQRDIIAVPAAG